MNRFPLTKSSFSYNARKNQLRLLFSSNINFQDFSPEQEADRLMLLKKENYFRPFEFMARDYNYQVRLKDLLKGIDNLKASIKIPPVNILQQREINLDDIKNVHKIMLSDIPVETYGFEDDDIQNVGEFWKVGVVANDVHETVYLYLEEVPPLMKRFIQFRDEYIIIMIFTLLLLHYVYFQPFFIFIHLLMVMGMLVVQLWHIILSTVAIHLLFFNIMQHGVAKHD
ncbi:5090_t:CDS:2 [Funneliformis mosseae]|uniref:5090_t:CDS:1 n=1 Tax=Funneliformis mosseae TaxID=27381 RepID=A0A9N9GVZ9_FUNMO|nr:5090_t:CDS:2 [Funneliformis mosseae]